MASQSSRRKGHPPVNASPLRALGSSSSRASGRRASVTPAYDEDSDEEELRICSQQSMADRVKEMAKDAGGGLSNLPKRKPTSPNAGTAAASSPLRRAGSKPKKQPNQNQANSDAMLASRSSDRLRKKDKPSYDYLLASDDDDSDFEDGKPTTEKQRRSTKRKRPDKTKRRAPLRREAGPAESPGTPELVLNIVPIKRRKMGTPSDRTLIKWEVERKGGLIEDEISFIGITFREIYSAPANNSRTAARFRIIFGRDPTGGELKEIFEINKPWGEKYYRFHEQWTALCRMKKKSKPADKNPRLTKAEVKIWFKEFVQENGRIQHSILPKKYASKKALDAFNRRKNQPRDHGEDEDEDDGDFMDDGVRKTVKQKNRPKSASAEDDGVKDGGKVPRRSPRKRTKTAKVREAEEAEDLNSEEEEENTKKKDTAYRIRKKSVEEVDVADRSTRNRRTNREKENESYGNGTAKRSRHNPMDVNINTSFKIPLKTPQKKMAVRQGQSTAEVVKKDTAAGEAAEKETAPEEVAEKEATSEKVAENEIAPQEANAASDEKKDIMKDSGKGNAHKEVVKETDAAMMNGKKEAEGFIGLKKDIPCVDKKLKIGQNDITLDEKTKQVKKDMGDSKIAVGSNQLGRDENEQKKDAKNEGDAAVKKEKSEPFRIRKKTIDESYNMEVEVMKMATTWNDGRIVRKEEVKARAEMSLAVVPPMSRTSEASSAMMNERRSISQLAASNSGC